jgi:predicted alpha/beta-fold hydrolase
LNRIRQRHTGAILVAFLWGNALLRWAEEMGHDAARVVDNYQRLSSPVDLSTSGRPTIRSFNRWVYTTCSLNSMSPKRWRKLKQHPGLFDGAALTARQAIFGIRQYFHCPRCGAKKYADYWTRVGKPLESNPHSALVVNALNDPFVPAWACLQQN